MDRNEQRASANCDAYMSQYKCHWHSEVEERGKKHNAELMAEKISDLMKTINPQIKDNQLNKKHEENHTNAHCEHIA